MFREVQEFAGSEGFEPSSMVLETIMLTIAPTACINKRNLSTCSTYFMYINAAHTLGLSLHSCTPTSVFPSTQEHYLSCAIRQMYVWELTVKGFCSAFCYKFLLFWWALQGLNLRPSDYESATLTN